MPYPRTSSSYPSAMRALVEAVVADNCGRRVDLPSPRKAAGLRGRFYAYITAIKRDLNQRPAWMSPADAADLTDFLKRAMTVQFRLDGPSLIIEPRDESPLTDALRQASPLPSRDATAPADQAADEVLAALLSRRK